MIQSIQTEVLDKVAALLNVGSVTAFAVQREAFEEADLPSAIVLPVAEQASYNDTDSIDITFHFGVHYEVADSSRVDKAADRIFVAGNRAILQDPTLGGLVRFTRYKDRKWQFEKGDRDIAILEVTYETEFSTPRSDPSSWA